MVSSHTATITQWLRGGSSRTILQLLLATPQQHQSQGTTAARCPQVGYLLLPYVVVARPAALHGFSWYVTPVIPPYATPLVRTFSGCLVPANHETRAG